MEPALVMMGQAINSEATCAHCGNVFKPLGRAGTTESYRSCKAAVDGWDGPGWREAAIEYHKQRGGRAAAVEIEPDRLARLHRLMERNVHLDRAWAELNNLDGRPTPQVTVEAIMYCVRERGLDALKEPANLERLSRCDAAALIQIDQRITKLRERAADAKVRNADRY
jgi:hypothetical protein